MEERIVTHTPKHLTRSEKRQDARLRRVWIIEGLNEIQICKAKQYSEVIANKFGLANNDTSRIKKYLEGIITDIDSTGIPQEEWEQVVGVVRRTSFTHTAFSPLPETAQLINLIGEYQRSHIQAPAKAEEVECIDGDGYLITSDGEIITRNLYFFKTAASTDFWDTMPDLWKKEAVSLSGLPFDEAKVKFSKMELPERKQKDNATLYQLEQNFHMTGETWERYIYPIENEQ
jgi:hypothetical protein